MAEMIVSRISFPAMSFHAVGKNVFNRFLNFEFSFKTEEKQTDVQ